ncbi:MAG TPA: PadR family transcriptional regulator [Acetobacteraceae bacterium]|nr:PadR family transcriptional regulator [Acetobacteraceae bacterium]
MSGRRKVANPLALAVLACLFERPMHPYEMAATMRERHKDESIKLNYGSLYTVVEGLARHKLIEPQETERAGNRPERTIYRITDAGRHELIDWLSDLICNPAREYTQFEAGLSLLPVLAPADAARLLEQRCLRLEIELAQAEALRTLVASRKVPRLFMIEAEYRWRLREAELAWVRGLAAEIGEGKLEGLAEWQGFHASGAGRKPPDK